MSQRSSIAFALAALAGCSGGGSSSPPGLPNIPVTLSMAGSPLQLGEGENGQLTLTATYPAGSAAVVPVVKFDDKLLSMPTPIDVGTPGKAVATLRIDPNRGTGSQGSITFQLCTDASCTSVYPGSQQSAAYSVSVKLNDWSGFQRNASHNGFVQVTLDPAKFAQVWSWQRPAGDTEPVGGINSVATGEGLVFVSKDVYFGQAAVYALNEKDGSLAWEYALGQRASEGPAAYGNGTVFVPAIDPNEQGGVWAINANTGKDLYHWSFSSQWSSFLAPAVFGDSVFNTSGSVYSRLASDGTMRWTTPAAAYDMSTPATDGQAVYQYGTGGVSSLTIIDFKTGALVAKIEDPYSPGNVGYSEFSAPLIADNGNVLNFSGGGFSGMAASSSEQYGSRVLVSYDVKSQKIAWRSAGSYLTHPAAAHGVVYVAGGSPARLDALSETDGKVLWSWALPADATAFHRNVVVTSNLVFVSTDKAVHAIDLATHQSVWNYPQPGSLAISASGILYINIGERLSNGKMVAIKLL